MTNFRRCRDCGYLWPETRLVDDLCPHCLPIDKRFMDALFDKDGHFKDGKEGT